MMSPALTLDPARAEELDKTVEFLYGEVLEDDRNTVRAMIVSGGSDEQIQRSLAIAAVNTRIEREDKSRYAFGCLRNIMMEDVPEDEADGPDFQEGHPQDGEIPVRL